MREIPQLQQKPGTALVLSGGATKAFYFHLGVLKALQLDDVSSIVGSSAGSVIGAFIAAGATVDDLITSLYQEKIYLPRFDGWVKTLTSTMLFKPKYMDITRQSLAIGMTGLQFLLSLPWIYNQDMIAEALDRLVNAQSHVTGFFDAVALENMFKSLLPSADFADTEIDLFVIATCLDCRKRGVFNGLYDFEDDHNLFIRDVPIHKAVRASTTIPGMFDPLKIHGRYYIDGEIKQTLSADIGVRLADRVIVSHTYQPLYLNEGSVRDLGWLNIIKQAGAMVLQERIDVWRQIYARQCPDKEIIWIQPEPDDVEFFTAPEFSFRPEIQKKMIKSGEVAALRALEQMEASKS